RLTFTAATPAHYSATARHATRVIITSGDLHTGRGVCKALHASIDHHPARVNFTRTNIHQRHTSQLSNVATPTHRCSVVARDRACVVCTGGHLHKRHASCKSWNGRLSLVVDAEAAECACGTQRADVQQSCRHIHPRPRVGGRHARRQGAP